MFEVDTVFVVATSRGSYIAEDLVRALRWTSVLPSYTIVVDRGHDVLLPAEISAGYTVIQVGADTAKMSDAFVRGVGIKWALDKQINCKLFVGLSDECMILQKGLDRFFLQRMDKQGLGLFGVIDRLNYEDAFSKCQGYFEEWELPHTDFTPDGHSIHDAVTVISAPLANVLFKRNVLCRADLAEWPLPYGPFLSWTAQMLGFYQVGWGQMDRQMPPLYVNHSGRSRFQPGPHILQPAFMLYYSARCAQSYSEEELREAYKLQRGEMAKQPDPMRPIISPNPDRLTVLG